MQSPARGHTYKFIVIPIIIVAIAVGVSYALINGAFSSNSISTSPEQSQNEEVATHIHSILSIIIEGERRAIPQNIGIEPALYKNHDLDSYGVETRIAPIHTLDSSGVIHIESKEFRGFTVGEFFDIWGVPFSENCILDKCRYETELVRMWVNGKESNEFRDHIFLDGEEIEIVLMPLR